MLGGKAAGALHWAWLSARAPFTPKQRYVDTPYLVGGKKFDLRIYALVMGYNPLRIYLYRWGCWEWGRLGARFVCGWLGAPLVGAGAPRSCTQHTALCTRCMLSRSNPTTKLDKTDAGAALPGSPTHAFRCAKRTSATRSCT